MKSINKNSWIVLPLLVLMSCAGWWFLGALTRDGITGDLLSWLAELPIVTCYALAALVAAQVGMNVTGMNLPNDTRRELMRQAADGNRDAERVLLYEMVAWFLMLAIALFFFVPAR